jgi:N-formylglutamate amidohydrolase
MQLYNLLLPNQSKIPILASLPHSGTYIPADIKRQFKQNPKPILTNMDWHLDKLYDFLPELGISVLQATHSRYVVDLNREVKNPLFGPYLSSVIFQENTQGRPLYDRELTGTEIESRLKTFCYPWHNQLKIMVDTMIREFGQVLLLDLHSYFLHPQTDICLGNCNGSACSAATLSTAAQAFRNQNFSVSVNDTLTGGYITRHYSTFANAQCLQIELRFPVYLPGEYFGEEEITEWDSPKFHAAKTRLKNAFGEIIKNLVISPTL